MNSLPGIVHNLFATLAANGLVGIAEITIPRIDTGAVGSIQVWDSTSTIRTYASMVKSRYEYVGIIPTGTRSPSSMLLSAIDIDGNQLTLVEGSRILFCRHEYYVVDANPLPPTAPIVFTPTVVSVEEVKPK